MGLDFELHDSVLHIHFLNHKSSNSFGLDEAAALAGSVKSYKKAKALLFTSGHPTVFCSGGDLKRHASLKNKQTGLKEAKAIGTSLKGFVKWPIPKAAFVHGDCFGGGLELLSCFNFRVAAPHVLLGFWQRRIGLGFGWGGFERWRASIGEERVRSLALSARTFGAPEALRIGIVNAIGPLETASAWASFASRWNAETATLTDFDDFWWSPAHRQALTRFASRK